MAPELELFLGMLLNPRNELFHHLERAPVAQEQVGKGREPPVLVESGLGPSLIRLAATRGLGHILPASVRGPGQFLPRPPTLEISRSDPLDAVKGLTDLRARVQGHPHPERQRHDAIRSMWLVRDSRNPPETKPRGSHGAVNGQLHLPRLEPLPFLELLLLRLLLMQLLWLLLLELLL